MSDSTTRYDGLDYRVVVKLRPKLKKSQSSPEANDEMRKDCYSSELLRKHCRDRFLTDVSHVRYALHEEPMSDTFRNNHITESFCDNVTVVYFFPPMQCYHADGRQRVFKQHMQSEKKYTRFVFRHCIADDQSAVQLVGEPFVVGEAAAHDRAEDVYNLLRDRGLYENYLRQRMTAVIFKVTMREDTPLDRIRNAMPDKQTELLRHTAHVLNWNVARDFAGIFDGEEMMDHLVRTRPEFAECVEKTSLNRLSWTNRTSSGTIYNKFVCRTVGAGNNILEFMDSPHAHLRSARTHELSKRHGITRLEITVRPDSTHLEPIEGYFEDAPFHSVSVPRMLEKLADSLQNSCVVAFDDVIYVAYWTNADRITGCKIKIDPDQLPLRVTLLDYVVSAMSFNLLPVNVMHCRFVPDGMEVRHECFIKEGETYFSRSEGAFGYISPKIDLNSVGFVSTQNLKPIVHRKAQYLCVSTKPPFTVSRIRPTARLADDGTKRPLEEEDSARKRKLREENLSVLKRQQKRRKLEELTVPLLRVRRGTGRLADVGTYRVRAFSVTVWKKTSNVIRVLNDDDGQVYYVKGPCEEWFNRAYDARDSLIDDEIVHIIHPNGKLWLVSKSPFLTIQTNGTEVFNNKLIPKITRIKVSSRALYDVALRDEPPDELPDAGDGRPLMKAAKGHVCMGSKCMKLEELAKDTVIVIVGVTEKTFRGKLKYGLQVEGYEKLFLSNYWFEKAVERGHICLKYPCAVQIGDERIVPNTTSYRLVRVKRVDMPESRLSTPASGRDDDVGETSLRNLVIYESND